MIRPQALGWKFYKAPLYRKLAWAIPCRHSTSSLFGVALSGPCTLLWCLAIQLKFSLHTWKMDKQIYNIDGNAS